MLLIFINEINGSRTHFPEKITKSLIECTIFPEDDILRFIYSKYALYDINAYINSHPKNFTIRRDKEEYWDETKIVEFSLDGKSLFLPSVPVISVQEILMTYFQGRFEISIDDRYIWGWDVLTSIALNDGFDTVTDFQLFYKRKMIHGVFSGKIIHWTNLRY